MATIRGGEKLKDALRGLTDKISRPATLRVGFLEGATYPDGTPVAMIAAIQDYGAPKVGIPPRPFFRNMVADKSPEWPNAIAEQLRANNYDPARTLDVVGAAIAGQLRDSILATNEPPLKDATIRRKGFAKPLVDTGHLLNSIDHEVRT